MPVRAEKRGQIAGHGRIGSVGQAEFAEAGLLLAGPVGQRHAGEEAIEQDLARFVALDHHAHAAADQLRSRAGQVEGERFGTAVDQQILLHASAHPDQHRPLVRIECTAELLLQVPRQGQVLIVAAQDQVIAYGHPVELDLVSFAAPHADQREIGRTAADVADQDLLARLDSLVPISVVGVDPGVEGRLRFFDQHHARQPGRSGCLDGQLASHFVERSGQRQHDVLFGQRVVLGIRIPGSAQMPQVARAGFDGRDPLDVLRGLPRQQVGRAIDAAVAQPALGGRNQSARAARPLLARQHSDHMLRRLAVPRQPQPLPCPFARDRLVVKRRQRLARFDLADIHQLRDKKRLHPPRLAVRIDVTDR